MNTMYVCIYIYIRAYSSWSLAWGYSFSKYFEILYIFAQGFKYFDLFLDFFWKIACMTILFNIIYIYIPTLHAFLKMSHIKIKQKDIHKISVIFGLFKNLQRTVVCVCVYIYIYIYMFFRFIKGTMGTNTVSPT